jgi:hypothetical protein
MLNQLPQPSLLKKRLKLQDFCFTNNLLTDNDYVINVIEYLFCFDIDKKCVFIFEACMKKCLKK